MKAVILAGGLGTRLRPLTNDTPKPLLPIKGRPIIWHAIMNLKKYGITDVILSVGFKHEKIREYFGNGSKLGVNIKYVVEDKPLGTGGAIRFAARDIDDTFIVLNGDNLADFDYNKAIALHNKNNAMVTIGLYPVEDVTLWGIADLNGDKIVQFIEKPSVEEAPTNLNNAGLYIMEPNALDILPQGPCSIEKDCFEKLSGPDGKVYAYNHGSQWFPTDNIEKYNHGNNNFRPVSRKHT